MKIFILTLIGFIFSLTGVAQTPTISKKYSNIEIEELISGYKRNHSRDVIPANNLKVQFRKDFPNAKDIDWEKAANIYKVDFEIGRIDYEAYYDNDANLLMYTIDIKEYNMPAVVKNAAVSKYPDYKFEDIEKVVRGTETFYRVEMEKGKTEIKANFDPRGIFIKEVYN